MCDMRATYRQKNKELDRVNITGTETEPPSSFKRIDIMFSLFTGAA